MYILFIEYTYNKLGDDMKTNYKIATLDFMNVSNNLAVAAQGVQVCIQTGSKGWFCLQKQQYPSRQELATITEMADLIVDDAPPVQLELVLQLEPLTRELTLKEIIEENIQELRDQREKWKRGKGMERDNGLGLELKR